MMAGQDQKLVSLVEELNRHHHQNCELSDDELEQIKRSFGYSIKTIENTVITSDLTEGVNNRNVARAKVAQLLGKLKSLTKQDFSKLDTNARLDHLKSMMLVLGGISALASIKNKSMTSKLITAISLGI
jgi:hypothetical protein